MEYSVNAGKFSTGDTEGNETRLQESLFLAEFIEAAANLCRAFQPQTELIKNLRALRIYRRAMVRTTPPVIAVRDYRLRLQDALCPARHRDPFAK